MPHGHPDYGAGAPTSTIYPILDIGELAARLGSIVTFDRRGNVIWLDDFEDTLKHWDHSSYNAEGSIERSTEAARNGAYSCKMITPTTLNKDTWIFCNRPLPAASKIGLEFSYAMYTNINYLYAVLSFSDSAGQYEYQLRYDRYNTTMAYLNSGGTYTDLPGYVSHALLYHSWNTIKLVVDYENQKYVRALLNSFSWDLSGIAPKFNSGSYTPALYIEARIQNRDAAQRYIYLDDVIVTQNEP